MTKKNKNYILIGVFALLAFFSAFSYYRDYRIDQLNNEIFASDINVDDGFSFFNVLAYDPLMKKVYKDTTGLILLMKRGETFKGKMGLINRSDLSHVYELRPDKVFDYDLEKSEKGKEEDNKWISVKRNGFKLDSDDVFFVEYELAVPENAENGVYMTSMQAVAVDKNADKLVRDGVVLDLAIGVPIYVFVGDEYPDVEYDDLSNRSKDLFFQEMKNWARVLLGIVLLGMTVYFVYRAYEFDKKSESKKK